MPEETEQKKFRTGLEFEIHSHVPHRTIPAIPLIFRRDFLLFLRWAFPRYFLQILYYPCNYFPNEICVWVAILLFYFIIVDLSSPTVERTGPVSNDRARAARGRLREAGDDGSGLIRPLAFCQGREPGA